MEEIPGGSRLVKAKPQHRNVAKGRVQQLSKGRGRVSDFCFCCLVLAIVKTTFLFGNYKSQSALWDEHALYQLMPSTNSQIWIRNQFWKRLTLAGYSPLRLRKGARQHKKQGKLATCKDLVQEFLPRGEAKNVLSLRRAAQHCTGDVGFGCDGGNFWNRGLLFQVGKWAAGAAAAEWVRSCFLADAPY